MKFSQSNQIHSLIDLFFTDSTKELLEKKLFIEKKEKVREEK